VCVVVRICWRNKKSDETWLSGHKLQNVEEGHIKAAVRYLETIDRGDLE
jgi:hypothetical protein